MNETDTVAAFRWQSCARSDVGCVRSINEDACLDMPAVGLWTVADGMGGHHAGDVASQMIVESLGGVGWQPRLGEMADEVEQRLDVVNRRLVELAAADGGEERVIGSTVTVLLALRRHGMVMWAGDSRIYRLRDGVLQQLTRDHSEFEDLLDEGLVNPDEAETHPSGNVITRAVGGSDELVLDSVRIDIANGDRFLLCTDGLYKELDEAEIGERLAAGGDCAQACAGLVDTALERGSRDNVTVVVVQFSEPGRS